MQPGAEQIPIEGQELGLRQSIDDRRSLRVRRKRAVELVDELGVGLPFQVLGRIECRVSFHTVNLTCAVVDSEVAIPRYEIGKCQVILNTND